MLEYNLDIVLQASKHRQQTSQALQGHMPSQSQMSTRHALKLHPPTRNTLTEAGQGDAGEAAPSAVVD